MSNPGLITVLLRRCERGDLQAEEELFSQVYARLHDMAMQRLRSERRDHTLQPTALIHEVFLSLARTESINWANRIHFFAIAAKVMRRVLIDYARQKRAAKRPEGQKRVDIDKAQIFSMDDPEFMISLDRSLIRLRQQSKRACQVVELRAFGGLSLEEIATSLGVSTRTVKRDWQMGKLWIYRELYGGSSPLPTMG